MDELHESLRAEIFGPAPIQPEVMTPKSLPETSSVAGNGKAPGAAGALPDAAPQERP